MFTVTLITCVAGAFVVDEATRELGGLVQDAIKRAGLTQDFIAATIRVPRPKLSDQLNGKAPLTCLYRFYLSRDIREKTQFFPELIDLLGERFGRVVLSSSDLQALLDEVRILVHHSRVSLHRQHKDGVA